MSDWKFGEKFGDVLMYREAGALWRFMLICEHDRESNWVQILYVPPEDDLWTCGQIILAGKKELILTEGVVK